MKLFSSSKGPGFWRGLFSRPSTWLLMGGGSLYLLQIFPFPGIYLMVVGGGFLAGTLLVLAVPVFFAEAVLGFAPRVLAVVPLALAGLYYGPLLSELGRLPRVADTLDLGVDVGAIAYDPNEHLIAYLPTEYLIGSDLNELLVRYRVPEIYNSKTDKALVLADTRECRHLGSKSPKGGPIYGTQVRSLRKSFCFTNQMVSTAGREILTIVERSELREVEGLQTMVTSQSINSNGTEIAAANRAHADVLPFIPRLFLGCGLNDSQASWQCSIQFLRQYVVIDPRSPLIPRAAPLIREEPQFADDVASMLSLQPRTSAEIEALVRLPERVN